MLCEMVDRVGICQLLLEPESLTSADTVVKPDYLEIPDISGIELRCLHCENHENVYK